MNFHGGQIKKEGLLDFSVNIPTLPYDEAYKTLLIDTIHHLYEYPEIDGEKARKSLSDYLGWPENQIVLGNGATDLIYLIGRAFKFDRAMILEPTFTEYRRALEQSGTEVFAYQMQNEANNPSDPSDPNNRLNKFMVSPILLAKKINEKQCQALYVCNPNNPTGTYFDCDFFKVLLEHVNVDSFMLILDESFIEFKERNDYFQEMKQLMTRYHVLVMRSMTKTFCVPGLRIGYVFGDKNAVDQINKLRDPWALNRFALESIPYLLNNKKHLSTLQLWCEKEADYLLNALLAIHQITVYESHANFILIYVAVENPIKWHEWLMNQGIYLRTCMDFNGLNSNFFRIAVKDRVSNQKLIEVISKYQFYHS